MRSSSACSCSRWRSATASATRPAGSRSGPLTFQFSELAKILMIIVLANYLAGRGRRLDSITTDPRRRRARRPAAGARHAPAGPRDVARVRGDPRRDAVDVRARASSGSAAMAAAVIAMVPIAWTYLLRDYQKERLTSFLNPKPDITDSGYQLYQSQIAVGLGRLVRAGPDERDPGAGRLPSGAVDRLRLLGPGRGARVHRRDGAVPAVRAAAVARRSWPAWRSRDPFGTLFASGIASMVLFQLFVNVGMVMGIMPITGIPLPFVTHGGASLVSIAIGLGHPPEHQHPPDARGVVTGRTDVAPRPIRPAAWPATLRRSAPPEQPSSFAASASAERRRPDARRIASISSRYGRPIGMRSSHSMYSRSRRAISPSDQPTYRPNVTTLPDGLPGGGPAAPVTVGAVHRGVVAAAHR